MIRWKGSGYSFLFAFVFAITFVISKGSEVKYKGKNVVQRGKPFSIECRISVFDYPKWTKDGYEIDKRDYDLFEKKDGKSHVILTLRVNKTLPEHAGYYRCNSFSREAHKISLLYEDDDYYDEEDDGKSSVVLKVNQTVKVYCKLGREDNFPVLWFKDNFRLLPGKDSNLVIKGKQLTIKRAKESDAGEYMCTSTDVSSLSRPAISSPDDVIGHITKVNYPAEVEPLPERISLKEGDNLILECRVHGSPVPKVQWIIGNIEARFYFDQDIDNRLELIPSEQGVPDAILYLKNLTIVDQSLYTCKAKNDLKEDEASVFVKIRDNMIQTNEKEPNSGIILEVNKPLVLQCNITDPNVGDDLMLKWKKDHVLLSDSDTIKIDTSNNSLIVNKPNENNHTGMYMCIFEDSHSEAYANATIIVSTRPSVEPFHKSLNLVQGDRLVLNCKFGGNPTPLIKWLKDDQELNMSDSRISITQEGGSKVSQLKIDDLDYPDRADYTCIAGIGEDSANTTILVRVKDRLAALWPFLGICAEVAILCTIIFVYEKKRAKPEFEDTDVDNAADKKNVQDQKEGHDVRQRK